MEAATKQNPRIEDIGINRFIDGSGRIVKVESRGLVVLNLDVFYIV